MTDAVGNVLRPPSRTSKAATIDEEILASYAGFTEKGLMIESGSGYLYSGTVLRTGVTLGMYRGATKAGALTPITSDEVQTVTITGTPTGGTFTLTYAAVASSAINHNSTAGQLQTILEAVSTIGVGNVVVTGGPGPGSAFTVTFTGALADTNVAQMTKNAAGLTGGTSPDVTVATLTQGGTAGSATETALAILRKDVDATSQDMMANYVLHGVIKGSAIKFTDDADGLTRLELKALALVLGGSYNAIHDTLSY